MKKLLVLCLALAMLVGSVMSVSAATTKYNPSPEKEEISPKVISAEAGGKDFTPYVVITPYNRKDKAINEIREILEQSYKEITSEDDLLKLIPALRQIAEKLGYSSSNLSISDLFHIYCNEYVEAQDGQMKIVLSAETFKGFVSLVCFKDNKWQIVDGATASKEGDEYYLSFTSAGFYPYAIVVHDGTPFNPESPDTGDTASLPAALAVMAVSAATLVAFCAKSKKKDNE